jgi:hypothetical protein
MSNGTFMAKTQDMNKARVKRMVELMLKNSAPMQCMLFFPSIMRNTGDSSVYDAITKEVLCVRDIYAKIDLSELDDDTGKRIIETNKPLVTEFFNVAMPIWEAVKISGFKPQNVPMRLDEICEIVNTSIDEYQRLPADRIYNQAINIGYLEHKHPGTHIGWFIIGKPVAYHLEKLPELVEFAQKLARDVPHP